MEYIEMDVLVGWMQEAFSLGKTFSYTPYGNSMLPTIQNGKYTITLAPCTHPKVQDIVLYLRPSGKYIIHRIVGKLRGGYMLCGDNENIIEYPISQKDILAKVIEVKNETGEPVAFQKRKSAYKNLWIKKLKLIIKKSFA